MVSFSALRILLAKKDAQTTAQRTTSLGLDQSAATAADDAQELSDSGRHPQPQRSERLLLGEWRSLLESREVQQAIHDSPAFRQFQALLPGQPQEWESEKTEGQPQQCKSKDGQAQGNILKRRVTFQDDVSSSA
mmetsp:Transcript_1032/g.2117  ORF Transcript_1032/g.2117 Transcript_1032/m.2117 type:complete len:134 (+) Transcript_1032:67-468(+)